MNGGREAATPLTRSRHAIVTASVMCASVMQTLDATIANVALPRIQGSMSATQDQMTWVLTSYIVAAAITIPMTGWLTAQIGRRRVFLYSIAGFTLASMLCGLAQSLPQIILARLLQGICGAALVPMSQAVMLDINPPERVARAMSVWVMGVTVGPILGPVLGGWLTDNYNWRWVFYINVPFGLLAFLGMWSALPGTSISKTRFDFFGFLTLSAAIVGLQLMLDRGQIKDWFAAPEIWIEATAAAVGVYLFVIHMLTTTKPSFISLSMFKDRNFMTGNCFAFVVGVVLYATLALLPPLLQDLMNYSVVTTGLVMAPRGIGSIAAMIIIGRIGTKIDARVFIALGFALTALSLSEMTGFDLQMSESTIIWSGLAQGVGTGLVFVPLTTVTFATLLPALRNEGTAFFSLMRNVGSSIGISVVETLLTRGTQTMHSRLAEHVTPFNPMVQQRLPGIWPNLHALAGVNAMVNSQARMLAYNNDFRLMMVLTLCAIPPILLLRRAQARSAAPAAME